MRNSCERLILIAVRVVILAITHRLSTIGNAHCIYVLQAGRKPLITPQKRVFVIYTQYVQPHTLPSRKSFQSTEIGIRQSVKDFLIMWRIQRTHYLG